jgi:hypothetical protein
MFEHKHRPTTSVVTKWMKRLRVSEINVATGFLYVTCLYISWNKYTKLLFQMLTFPFVTVFFYHYFNCLTCLSTVLFAELHQYGHVAFNT